MFPGIDPFSMILLPVMINIATGSVKPEAFLTHFKTKQKPINHDLQKAVKTAYLQALIEIAQEFKSGRVRPSRHYAPTAIELQIKQWQEEIKNLAKANSEVAIESPLGSMSEIEQLLLSHGQSSDNPIKDLETKLVAKALERIADLPVDYQEQVQTGLFARVYAHFVEQLKTNDRAYRAFELECLTTLKQDVAETLARLDPQKPELTAAQWRTVGQMMFSDRQALTSNLFSSEDGVELKSLEVYVPLGLEERKERPRVQGDRTPEEFSPQQTTLTPISEDEFFTQILQPGQKSIAIIGEPGSGKTTRLQAVGDRIFRDHLGLPIWVSLGKLGNQSLGDYLRQWLRDATGHDSLWADFQAQFGLGRVWLLLDGLDEMTTRIDAQQGDLVRGWWSEARLLLTCRGNVWDANRGALQDFAVYRNLDFTPAQVEDYIQRWFRAAGQEGAGTELHTALQQENHARLRDLVRHPLRLSLLCCAWHGGERSLPETQAGLYAQFVEQVYEWKATFIKTSPDQRRALQAKLSELSLLAIEGKDAQGRAIPRFWFRESLVKRVFGGVDDPLCDLALRVGWLINLGKTAEKPIETAYGFYHATFQEYFAALGVESWDYFLPRDHESSPVEGREYRIFEPQWKQVILLWLGREDIADEQKEEFINKLVNFNTGCDGNGDFYYCCAYFLAAAGINEFKACSLAAEIVRKVVKWGFGYFDIKKQEWQTFLNPIKEGAKQTIPETIRQLAITELINILEHCPDEGIRGQAADSLGKIGQGNSQAITALIKILEPTENGDIYWEEAAWEAGWHAVESLGKIGQGNQEAIATLIKILETTENKHIRWLAANILGEIGQGNQGAIAALIKLLETTEDKGTRWRATDSLGEIGQGNPHAIAALIRILETTEDEDTRSQVVLRLGEIAQGNLQAIAALIRILETTENKYLWTRACKYLWQEAVESLGEIGQGNPHAIAELIKLLETTEDEDTRWHAASSLGKVGQGNPQAIAGLIKLLETTENESTRRVAASSLDEIDKGNPQAIAGLIKLLETTENEKTRCLAAYSLGEIDKGNPQAIAGLIKLLETTENEDTRWQAASSLGKVGQGNPQAIAGLIKLLETTENEIICRWAASSLGEIDKGNPQAIAGLIKLLETTEDEDTRWHAAYSLQEIDQGNPHAIAALIRILETTEDKDTRWQVVLRLGEIGQGNPHAIAALIRILETTEDENIRRHAVESLGEIGQGNPHAIAALIRVLETTENKYLWRRANEYLWQEAVESLGKIGQGNPHAIAALIRILETNWDEIICRQAADSLGKIGQGNPHAIAALIKILETTEDEDTRWSAADSLGKVGQGNQEAITALIKILETTENEKTRWLAAYSLQEIDQGNQEAIAVLIEVLETTEDKNTRRETTDILYESLGKIGQGDQEAIAALIKILETPENKETRWLAAYSLQEILTTPEQYVGVISALKDYLSNEVYQNNFDRFNQCYRILWDCAANLPYPDFYHAWHSTPE